MILYQQRGNRLYFIVISCLIFNMAGSPPVVHLRYYAHSNGISPTMPASPPPYASISALSRPYNNTFWRRIIDNSHGYGSLVLDMAYSWLEVPLR